MPDRHKPRNRMRCPCCFRVIGATRHLIITWHKYEGRKCPGTGLLGGDL